jgi:hypothetical protein
MNHLSDELLRSIVNVELEIPRETAKYTVDMANELLKARDIIAKQHAMLMRVVDVWCPLCDSPLCEDCTELRAVLALGKDEASL